MEKKATTRIPARSPSGCGQLTLVEHSLCPLDPAVSLAENLVHDVSYVYTDRHRHTQVAQAKVICPLGLSAHDEFFLWGLLSLAVNQPTADREFYATPHYCLRRLGVVDPHSRRGGRQYQQFHESLTRLSAVVYQNDRFYDPIRAEHRQVSFGFFSFSLPTEPDSSRAWRISWNPLFFEFVQAAAGGLRFDLGMYRRLEPASRRLFLLLAKIFRRRAVSPRFGLHNLACDVLGFSPSISAGDLKKKVRRCVERLASEALVAPRSLDTLFVKEGVGDYRVLIERGPYFERTTQLSPTTVGDSALFESLGAIGVESATARRLIQDYPARTLQEWADITLAARERFGASFFRKSPTAYLIDNLQQAATSGRTPPDWWLDLRKAETRLQAERHRSGRRGPASAERQRTAESDLFREVRDGILQQFLAAGQPRDAARANADRFAAAHVERQSQPRGKEKLAGLRAAISLRSRAAP